MMQRFYSILSFLGLLCVMSGTGFADETQKSGTAYQYRLGTGDVVRVDVFGEPDLSLETRLSDTGTISYPLLGELSVNGLTVSALEQLVTSRLKGPILINPQVTVSVVEYRKFFVNGEVAKPGSYPYEPGLTVGKAISLAGGRTERAHRRKAYIVHENQTEAKRVLVNMDDKVRPGDILIIEESFW